MILNLGLGPAAIQKCPLNNAHGKFFQLMGCIVHRPRLLALEVTMLRRTVIYSLDSVRLDIIVYDMNEAWTHDLSVFPQCFVVFRLWVDGSVQEDWPDKAKTGGTRLEETARLEELGLRTFWPSMLGETSTPLNPTLCC